MLLVAAISCFMNNTPLVAIFTPLIRQWARQMELAPSKINVNSLIVPIQRFSVLPDQVNHNIRTLNLHTQSKGKEK